MIQDSARSLGSLSFKILQLSDLSDDKREQERLRLEDMERRTSTLQHKVDICKLCKLYTVRSRSRILYVHIVTVWSTHM